MLRKIDCVMVTVPDLEAGAAFYTETFGLRRLWQDEKSIGLGMAETDAEIVLHTALLDVSVHYLVDDVDAAVRGYPGRVRTAPFDIAVGRCAVVEDPFGNAVGILDLRKGLRS
ncbi:hypothetical protein Ade02nite_46640 [Paractinoplanes deccanensis]|uniref:VOC domain-containing protein n=1 Tax=Paractinoplanes deccanensis TaxID=113561 RepID=A0ABQ3Y7R0_9ACTN|nr:VOC family protein [Actinoplanes deccanensis]GID76023.1 hypothetical protein Ade02nite_46640 [Actinoplanes deccanensis]